MARVLLILILATLTCTAATAPDPVRLGSKSSRQRPFSCVGQLFFKSGSVDYIGSGTIIGARSVLTAGHNVYDPDFGWSTNFEYYRATYGSAANPVRVPNRRYLFAGYRANVDDFGASDVRSFAYDSAGISFSKALYAGIKASYSSNRDYLKSHHFQVLVGYGAEGSDDGSYPLCGMPSGNFTPVWGNFWENYTTYVEGGMSGGPLLSQKSDGTYVLIGVVVSGSTRPRSGGVRLLDSQLTKFIKTYLP